ncbi:MAG: PIN domain-containing protein [Pirellulales bacterium]
MAKPTVYLDTTIISAYWFEGKDPIVFTRRLFSRRWWTDERQFFVLYTSIVSEREFRAGRYARQEECIKMNRRLNYLSPNKAVRELGRELLDRHVVPLTKPDDAAHLAVASVHGIDYLLTWNYAHLANPEVQKHLTEICKARGLSTPTLVTPESIPWASHGQRIKRRKDHS